MKTRVAIALGLALAGCAHSGASNDAVDAGIDAPAEAGDAADAATGDAGIDAQADATDAGCPGPSLPPTTKTTWDYCPNRCEALVYGGQTYTQTYALSVDPSSLASVRWRASVVLDDHATPTPYCLNFIVNGTPVGTNVPLTTVPHGAPFNGAPFTNFQVFSFEVPLTALVRGDNRFQISTWCAGTNDWVAIEWSELVSACP